MIFFIKSLLFTFLLVILLQIRVGDFTLEERATLWAQKSVLIQPLELVAQGATKVVRDSWRRVTGNINTRFWQSVSNHNQPGARRLVPELKRSQEYIEEKVRKLQAQENQEVGE